MHDEVTIIDEFCKLCAEVRISFDLYRSLFEAESRTLQLYSSVAPHCFGDLNGILVEHVLIQFCKVTDPAKTGKHFNLTTNYILNEIPWPREVAEKLAAINDRLLTFRQKIEPARSKRIAHVDFTAQIERWPNLGKFPKGEDCAFLRDLQEFVNVAYGHFHNGESCSIVVAMSTDTYKLVRALQQSELYDDCQKCTAGERAIAVLDAER